MYSSNEAEWNGEHAGWQLHLTLDGVHLLGSEINLNSQWPTVGSQDLLTDGRRVTMQPYALCSLKHPVSGTEHTTRLERGQKSMTKMQKGLHPKRSRSSAKKLRRNQDSTLNSPRGQHVQGFTLWDPTGKSHNQWVKTTRTWFYFGGRQVFSTIVRVTQGNESGEYFAKGIVKLVYTPN